MIEKSIRELAWNVPEEEYRADRAISYSTLSRFEREGWRKLEELFLKQETLALRLGSVIDTWLTEGEAALADKFIICEFPALSETLRAIANELYSRFGTEYRKLSDIPETTISEVAVANEYYVNQKYEAFRVKKVKEECEEYYSLLHLAETKIIISQEEYNKVLEWVDGLITSPYTEFFFSPAEEGIEKVFQLKFKAEFEGQDVRCMFDEIIVDHINKVIHPIDLKSSIHPEEEFEGSFWKWRYDIQATLYTYILGEIIKNDPYFSSFRIAPYMFVVIGKKTNAPMVWEFKGNHSLRPFKVEDKVYRNWREILGDLTYYLGNPGARYSKEVLANDGVMEINWETV